VGGGALPPGPATAQLLVVAGIVGALACTLTRANDTRALFVLLAAGQLAGHGLLSAIGHSHTAAAAPAGWVMALAHLSAVAIGALLINAGDRLCRAMSRALRRTVRRTAPPVPAVLVNRRRRADHPLHSTLQLDVSMSHRGPPAAPAR
jgi:hypothetical protein